MMTGDDSARGRVLSLWEISGGAAEDGDRAVKCVQARGGGTLVLAAGLHQVVRAKLSCVLGAKWKFPHLSPLASLLWRGV